MPLWNRSVLDCLIPTCISDGRLQSCRAISPRLRSAWGSYSSSLGTVISPVCRKPKKQHAAYISFVSLSQPDRDHTPFIGWSDWEACAGPQAGFSLVALYSFHNVHTKEIYHSPKKRMPCLHHSTSIIHKRVGGRLRTILSVSIQKGNCSARSFCLVVGRWHAETLTKVQACGQCPTTLIQVCLVQEQKSSK